MRVNSPSKGRRDSLDYAPYANIDHGGCIGGYPLGRWVAEQHRAYGAGVLEAKRVVKLEKLGTVWSEQEAAWSLATTTSSLWWCARATSTCGGGDQQPQGAVGHLRGRPHP
ncbi:helicase associated domain-containing protein [Streptomyces sp. NPDC001933]|uniref:helicase associated domain-containing protein n=1 Tax=Streptomyces sp. NPDC001933 TaxID=3364626 RepID=UPI00367ACA17